MLAILSLLLDKKSDTFWTPPEEAKGWHSPMNTALLLERNSNSISLIIIMFMPRVCGCVCACTRVLSRVLFFATSKPTRLLCPWDFSGKNTGVGYHFLLQGIFPTQESKSHSVVTVHPDPQTVFLQDLLLASRFWWLLLSPLVYPVWVLIMSAWGDLASLLTLQSRDSRRIHRWFFRCCYGGQLCDQHTLSRLITFLLSESSY